MSSAPRKSSPAKPADPRPAQADHTSPCPSATSKLPLSRYLTFASLAAAGCTADLLTKTAVFRWLGVPAYFLDPRDPAAVARWRGDASLDHLSWLIDQRLGFQTSLNTGAVFGLGAGWWWLFAIFAVVALVSIVVWLFRLGAAHDRWLTVTLGLVTGGILGNLYDRLGLWSSAGIQPAYRHAVRDWILFQWPESGLPFFSPWPNFNIADSLLVTGAIMLVVHACFWREPAPESQPERRKIGAPSGA